MNSTEKLNVQDAPTASVTVGSGLDEEMLLLGVLRLLAMTLKAT